jgi:uncharacterized membrane protein YsdA (DUF1294 family)
MARHNPNKLPFVMAIGLIGIASALLWWMDVNLLYAYLLSVSVTTFLFYGYDKRQALRNGWRVPEAVLHVLALSGGTPGAFVGQIFFRHKTRKLRFKVVFVAIVLLQALLGYFSRRYWIGHG